MAKLAVTVLAVAASLLAGCGGGKEWPGPPAPAADGTVSVAGFHSSRRSPIDTAAAFLRLDEHQAATTSIVSRTRTEAGRRAIVTATFDRLPDDSIRAQRYVLRLEEQDDGTWKLLSAALTQRCWPGRGHEAFSPEPCV